MFGYMIHHQGCIFEITQMWDAEYMQRSFMNATFMVNVMQQKLYWHLTHMDNTSGVNLSTIYI